MEKRTLGSFLAVLRKANGMTQRELAEKLGVSDKAVSRWERDECAPDLTLIPVIADIFGVTSDELLRGARAEKADREETSERTVRSDKQIDLLLKSNETKYLIQSLFSLGILIIGIIVATIFLGSAGGILVGGICLVVAVICQIVFSIRAFSAVNTDEFDIQRIKRHRRNLVNTMEYVVFIPALMIEAIGFLLLSSMDAIYRMVGLAFFPLILLLWWIVQKRLAKTEFCSFNMIERNRLRLKIKTWMVTAILVCVTFAGQCFFNNIVSATVFTKGTTFDNYDDFKGYMETPTALIDCEDELFNNSVIIYPDGAEFPIPGDDSDSLYEEITDKDGNVLVSYQHKNRRVVRMKFGENTLPITTYTTDQLYKGVMVMNTINDLIYVMYLLETLGGVLVYFIIRNRRNDS